VSVDLARVIRPGDGIVCGMACAEPQTLTEALVAQRAAFSGATLFLGVNYSGIVKPEHADHLRLTSYCGAGHNRALADAGVLDIHPHPYSRLGALIRTRAIPADVVLVQVSPPNAKGEYSPRPRGRIPGSRARSVSRDRRRGERAHPVDVYRPSAARERFRARGAFLPRSGRPPPMALRASSSARSRAMQPHSFPTAQRWNSASARFPARSWAF
jgi:hypothetical protein